MLPCQLRGAKVNNTECRSCGKSWDIYACDRNGHCTLTPLTAKAERNNPEWAGTKSCETCPDRTVDGAVVGLPTDGEIRKERHADAKARGAFEYGRDSKKEKRERDRKIRDLETFTHGTIDRICRTQLNADELETNPSIIAFRGRKYLAYQQNESQPHLYFAELGPGNEPFGPDECRLINNHLFEESRGGQSLPKLFVHDRELWAYYTGVSKNRLSPMICRLNSFGEVSYETPIGFPGSKRTEDSWAFWSTDGELMASYSIWPHVTLRIASGNAKLEAVSGWDCPMPGRITAAASPLLVDDLWHTWIGVENDGVQTLGLVLWENKHPWRVVKCSRRPLLAPQPDWSDASITPGGAIYLKGEWRVSFGANKECKVVTFDAERLNAELVAVDGV